MNKIEKQKGVLVGLGVAALILSAILLVGGILMLLFGIPMIIVGDQLTKGIILTVLGGLCLLMFLPTVAFGIYDTWIGSALKATRGSLKEDNLAKVGTINMIKCSRCGEELKEGETVCSNCEKPVE